MLLFMVMARGIYTKNINGTIATRSIELGRLRAAQISQVQYMNVFEFE